MRIMAMLSIGLVGCKRETEIEIPDDELNGKSEQEQHDAIFKYINEWAQNFVEIGWKRV